MATVTITPTENTWMAGYSSRDSPSNGVEQDLYATTLALRDDAGTRFVVVSADLLGISREIRREVVAAVQEEHDLPPESLLLAGSHTHCGPEFRRSEFHFRTLDAEQRDRVDAYVDRLIPSLCEVVADALADLAPATLGYTQARAGTPGSRRRKVWAR